MAPYPNQPVIDTHNPCYCPALPARAYIHHLHQDLATNPFSNSGLTHSLGVINHFTRRLAQTVNTPGLEPGDKGVQDSDSETSSGSGSDTTTTTVISHSSSSTDSGNEQFHSVSSRPRALTTSALGGGRHITEFETLTTSNISFNSSHLTDLNLLRFNALRDSRLLVRPLRKRKEHHHNQQGSDSDSGKSDIRGPSKHAKSIPGTLERSFDVKLKRESLNFNLPSSRQVETDSSWIPPFNPPAEVPQGDLPPRQLQLTKGSNDLEKLLEEIKKAVPGIRIPSDFTKPQMITDYLAQNGLLSGPLMKVIGKFSGVRRLSLFPSLHEYNGLNLGRVTELLPELHTPGLFTVLVSLNCDRIRLRDDDVLHFHNLPLRDLSLYDTGISNTAVFLLSSHRHTLRWLSIGSNNINDDAIPALMAFKQLNHLNIDATEISMEGLRRYARNIHIEKRAVYVEIPTHCQKDLDEISNQHLSDIDPPLISEPDSVWKLSLVELRNNLAAHCTRLNRVVITGNKAELRERLMKVLCRRKDDLLVKEMMENGKVVGDEDDEDTGLGEYA